MESQEEMDHLLEQSFGSSTNINEKEFLKITEEKHSELFLYVNPKTIILYNLSRH